MMKISKKQCAIINSVVKPYKITTNYLSPSLLLIVNHYTKYFSRRRYVLIQSTRKNKSNHCLTLKFNCLVKRGGFGKEHRAHSWNFYGMTIQTKYGKQCQRKVATKKRKRAKKRKQQKKNSVKGVKKSHDEKTEQTIDVSCDSSQQQHKSDDDSNNVEQTEAILSDEVSKENADAENTNENNATNVLEKSAVDDDDDDWKKALETADAVLMTESDADDSSSKQDKNLPDDLESITEADDQENKLVEELNSLPEDNANNLLDDEASKLTAASKESEGTELSAAASELSQENEPNCGVDINEKLRQQLKLLKMGKNESTVFATKPSQQAPCTRSSFSFSRRSTSEELKGSCGSTNSSASSIKENGKEEGTSTSIGGRIDSLFTKIQSISRKSYGERPPSRRIAERKRTSTPQIKTSTPTISRKQSKSDDSNDNSNVAFDDSNMDDSNQSSSSIPMEFFGFDISNKNVDVSALLPTPKVSTSNNQSAFVSEDLDIFMKENSLECAKVDVKLPPKKLKFDEALMTVDAAPPTLAVPKRPIDMHKPRTLAEKRMILEQNNDHSMLIIENESTVYHELKRRTRLGSDYDNSLIQNIQEAMVPFTRDCWKAACWISTANNRFYFRTISANDEEIKLTGGRGDNEKKLAFELTSEKIFNTATSKYLLAQCKNKCLPINNFKINNIDAIMADVKINQEELNSAPKSEHDLKLKKPKLNMFSQNYMTPGPKCKKTKCKTNRSSSFDLEYGPLEVLPLPKVQVEVWPQIGFSLPDHIKPILKTLLPETNIVTPDWANFAVSVVQEPQKTVKNRRKYIKPEALKSFVFDIPYENDEKKILIRRRRRSTIIFNKNDAKYENIDTFYQDPAKNVLDFTKNVDESDPIAVECSDILSNMIESIGIAVNETNFTKQDPDIDYVGKVVSKSAIKEEAANKIVKKTGKEKSTKTDSSKNKLMKELKRLNVTVIDAAFDSSKVKKEEEICGKAFCKFGCVCESIDAPKSIQTHCRLTKCMFGCVCTSTLFKPTNPFYVSEDIDLLHAQANARLAKVEKEFKATIVVSENDMFVLPNSHTASKRSSRKPKRFTNDETTTEDIELEAPYRSKRRRTNDKITTEALQPILPAPAPIEHDPIKDEFRRKVLGSIQHVLVELDKLPDLSLEPWCMVHCLYKCHCKGKSQKGRMFSFTKNKNLNHGHHWEVAAPRKRQYTFERDQITANEEPAIQEIRKVPSVDDDLANFDLTTISARTTHRIWKHIPRKSPQELKILRNESLFAEEPFSRMLKERIQQCRSYNKSQNILSKSLANDKSSFINTAQSANPPPAAIRRLNQTIAETMKLIVNSRNQSNILNPALNKLSICAWDRVLNAFRNRELFIWEVHLANNNKTMILTETFTKPQNQRFLQITNINYTDIHSLPLVGRMLRQNFQNEKTKSLAMLLLRLDQFWRILGVIHSDLKSDVGILAQPTPDKNPLLSKKINTLYHLLVRNEQNKSGDNKTLDNSELNFDTNTIENDQVTIPQDITPDLSNTKDEAIPSSSNAVSDAAKTEGSTIFSSGSGRLSLPIPVNTAERLLMLNVGDDFTHIWFPNCRKFLSMKKIRSTLAMAKHLKHSIEITQGMNFPKVFVTHTHDNNIFIGPYKKNDKQNLALFVRQDNHMVLADSYHKKFGVQYTKKSKASWIYPNKERETPSQILLKINQVYSEYQSLNENDVNTTTAHESNSVIAECEVPSDTNDQQILENGPETISHDSLSPEKDPDVDMDVEQSQEQEDEEDNSIAHSSEPLPLLISSVTSGDGIQILANGTSQEPETDFVETTNDLINSTNIESTEDTNLEILHSDITITKTEPIEISDDENEDNLKIDELNEMEQNLTSLMECDAVQNLNNEDKGFLFCETNRQLGKVNVVWISPNRIKLFLKDKDADDEVETDESEASAAMSTYIRKWFYGVYPTTLKLHWTLVKFNNAKQVVQELPELNSIEPLSVVFKDKIVQIDSDYRDNFDLPAIEKYVIDIFKLASQLLDKDVVKSLNISEVMKKARKIDKEEIQKQTKYMRLKSRYMSLVDGLSSKIPPVNEEYHNGDS